MLLERGFLELWAPEGLERRADRARIDGSVRLFGGAPIGGGVVCDGPCDVSLMPLLMIPKYSGRTPAALSTRAAGPARTSDCELGRSSC